MTVEVSTGVIRSYHAHIYFRDSSEREHALQLREWIDQRFSVQLGRVHNTTVGPHTAPMYQVAFAPELFHDLPHLPCGDRIRNDVACSARDSRPS